MIEAFSTNLLDMGLVAWSMEHPQAGGVNEYIDLVRRSANTLAPQWPEHVAIGGMCEWAIVMPPTVQLPDGKAWGRTLQAMCGKYQLPMPLRITVNHEQRDLLNASLWFVGGPIMLVTHAINHWRSPTHFLDGRAGVWWDSRPVIPVRKFTIPECDESFKVAWMIENETWAGVGEYVGKLCVKCGAGATEWDRDAVPYCQSCWTKGQTEWMTARHQWIAKTNSQAAF